MKNYSNKTKIIRMIDSNYSSITNSALMNVNLSDTALRLLIRMLNNREDYIINTTAIQKEFRYSNDKMASAMKNLVENGYVIKEKITNDKNQFIGVSYIINESGSSKTFPTSDFPEVGFSEVGKNNNYDDSFCIKNQSESSKTFPTSDFPKVGFSETNNNNYKYSRYYNSSIIKEKEINKEKERKEKKKEKEKKEMVGRGITVNDLVLGENFSQIENEISYSAATTTTSFSFEPRIPKINIELTDSIIKQAEQVGTDNQHTNQMIHLYITNLVANGVDIWAKRPTRKIKQIQQRGENYKSTYLYTDIKEAIQDPNYEMIK